MDRQTLECIQKSHYISMAGQQLVESRLPMKFNYPKSIKIDLYERIEKDKISRLALIFFDSREAQEWYDQVHQSDAPLNVHRRVSIFANVVFVITEGSKQITVYVDFITEFYNPKPLCVLQHTTSEKEFYYQIHWEFKGFISNLESIEVPARFPDINRQYISQFGSVSTTKPARQNDFIKLESSSDEIVIESSMEKPEKQIQRVNSQKSQIQLKQDKKQKAMIQAYDEDICDIEILI